MIMMTWKRIVVSEYTPDGRPVIAELDHVEGAKKREESRRAQICKVVRKAIERHIRDNGMVTAPERLIENITERLIAKAKGTTAETTIPR